jgi:hypothetical protein
VSAKLRVLKDMIGSSGPATHPETDAQAALLEGIVTDANRLAETGT